MSTDSSQQTLSWVNNSFLFSSRVETHGRASLREIYFQFSVFNFQFSIHETCQCVFIFIGIIDASLQYLHRVFVCSFPKTQNIYCIDDEKH